MNSKKTETKNSKFGLEKVRQGNEFVKSFYRMTAEQQNIFYFAVANLDWNYSPFKKFFEGNPITKLQADTFCSHFTFKQMFEKLDLPYTKNIIDVYVKNFSTLSETVVKTVDEKGGTKWTPLFSMTVLYKGECDIVFNPFFLDMIFQEKYTTADLRVLGQLSKGSRNNYAQRLYFYLAMFRNTQGKKRYHNENKGEWKVKMTEQYFRELVQMPKDESARKNNFRAMIRNLVKKINANNFEFTTTVEFGGYGSDTMTFICNENMNLWKLSKDDSATERAEKLEMNKENEEAAYFRQKFADEWNEILSEELQNNVLFGGEEFKESLALASTLKRMKELHKDDLPEIQ